MRRVLLIAIVLLTGGGIATPAGAQDSGDSSSQEAALFLLQPIGAQAVSMGRAMTAMEGPESAFWNPAGLAGVDGSRVVLFRGDHLAGTGTAVSAVWSSSNLGTLGGSYFLQNVGELDQTDENNNYTGTITIRNHLGVISGATRLFDNLSAGASFKVVQFRLTCRGICDDAGTTATTYAVDAGFQMLAREDLRIGGMIAHLGPKLQVLNADQADPLPTRFRLAVAYDVLHSLTEFEDLGGWITLEVEDRLRDPGHQAYYLGAELSAGNEEQIALRAGYAFPSEAEGAQQGTRVGLGLRYERFDMSIAKAIAVSNITGEPEPVHVTLSIVF